MRDSVVCLRRLCHVDECMESWAVLSAHGILLCSDMQVDHYVLSLYIVKVRAKIHFIIEDYCWCRASIFKATNILVGIG